MVSFLDGKGDDIILELKTTRDADPKKFYRDCLTYDYHMQAGIYVEGIRCREFKFPDHYFIAVEKEAPFGISVLKSDAGFIKYGQKMYRRAMDMMKYCIEKREFESSYEFHSITGYHNLELPYYMTKELDDE